MEYIGWWVGITAIHLFIIWTVMLNDPIHRTLDEVDTIMTTWCDKGDEYVCERLVVVHRALPSQ
jgi:hypothetical protein